MPETASTVPFPNLTAVFVLSATSPITLTILYHSATWLFWLCLSVLTMTLLLFYSCYTLSIILFDVLLLSLLKTSMTALRMLLRVSRFIPLGALRHSHSVLRRDWSSVLRGCRNVQEFRAALKQWKLQFGKRGGGAGGEVGVLRRKSSFSSSSDLSAVESSTSSLLSSTSKQLRSLPPEPLRHLVTSLLKRNHLGIDDTSLDATKSIADVGRGIEKNTAAAIEDFEQSLVGAIRSLCDEKLGEAELVKSLKMLERGRKNLGQTALMLSGGGSITMYHLGLVRALLQDGLYGKIGVVSGTSGGSIAAAFCATKTEKELREEVCVDWVSTDYSRDGDQGRKGVRWFPTMANMARNWLRTGLLVRGEEFRACTNWYFGDITFEEAFAKTGKHVCMTVTASRAAAGGGGTQRLLLNHISTPHVTIASAVAASCALPGIMPTAKLQCRVGGELSLFEVDGVEWIDGSVQADVPFARVGQLFNVTNFIVSQCNFHVVPFLPKAHTPHDDSAYSKVFSMLGQDIRSRVMALSRLGLFPLLYGNDVSKVFKQKYHGDITIIPKMRLLDVLGIKAFLNPTVEDMRHYLRHGEVATWPAIDHIRQTTRFEAELGRGIERLEGLLGMAGAAGREAREEKERREAMRLGEMEKARAQVGRLEKEVKALQE
ncbi:hypothetical protein TeGR_g2443, partial [Tetraparma gracilis]